MSGHSVLIVNLTRHRLRIGSTPIPVDGTATAVDLEDQQVRLDLQRKKSDYALVSRPGDDGTVGATGPAGSTGSVGATGAAGPTGAIAQAGVAGNTGATGAAGATGAMGAKGARGVEHA